MNRLLMTLGFLLAASATICAQARPEETLGVKIGDPRPPLSFRLLSGKPLPKWSELEGKVVVIDFWASWCSPCLEAIPKMNQFHQQFADRIAFFSVTYEPSGFVKGFLRDYPIDGMVGIDDELATFKTFKAWGIPVVFIFDGSGKLVAAVHPRKLTSTVLSTALQGQIPTVEQAQPWNDPAGAEGYFRKLQKELQEKFPKSSP